MELDLYIIPRDPSFVLADEIFWEVKMKIEELIDSFEDLYYNLKYVQQSKTPSAVGVLQSIDGIKCPSCNTDLNFGVDEWDDWLSEFNDVLFGKSPLDAQLKMPCCSAQLVLRAIDLGSAIRFSKFVISIHGSSESRIEAAQLAELQTLIGCDLMQFNSACT